ncbi:MAG: hypothetical protein N4A49_02665 [Marinifilaceae bacterium]|jgi:hypothetical protein|nr:hypothetical protein [Marinifilaceae bacterium]
MEKIFILLISLIVGLSCTDDDKKDNETTQELAEEQVVVGDSTNTDLPNITITLKADTTGLPTAIKAYQVGANSENIEWYLHAFTDDAVMVDVSREFKGKEAIRTWANREVIPSGQSFQHVSILEQSQGYAKTLVNWLSWQAHYYYWWNEQGKITKMSLQYAN